MLLAWVPTLPVPRLLAQPIGWLASASMWIFMTHWLIWPELTPHMPPAVAMVGTIAIGVTICGRRVAELFRQAERFRMVEHPSLWQNPPLHR